jgi:uncharacterized membrane protein (UPF0127 family)
MPVLIERSSLVVRDEVLRRAIGALKGGLAGLGAEAMVSDGALTALHLPPGAPAQRAVAKLEEVELYFWARDLQPGDLAAVGQQMGPLEWWPWLELAAVPGPGGGQVLAARLGGSLGTSVAVPEGWRFEDSSSARRGVCALPLQERPLRHLRREPGANLFRDRWTGEEHRLRREHAPVRVVVEAPGGGGELTAELVTREEEVELGLMFREEIGPDQGMLFRFEVPDHHGFWMKNTLVPLDLLFVGDDGRVVNVTERVEPLTVTHRWSRGPVRSVLEVAGGWCQAHGVGAGARVVVVGCAAGG